jgi:hypothetical protein
LLAAAVLAPRPGLESQAAAGSQPAPAPRVAARSDDLLAVGTVHGARMTIHLSSVIDNAPVRDAVVAVLLRGTRHSTVAEPDGSYTLETPDVALPGTASVQFEVTRPGGREQLKGTLEVADSADKPGEKNSSRQLGWWVLNFAVCIGFLMLWRRRKGAKSKDSQA